jgi:hypothetical protein
MSSVSLKCSDLIVQFDGSGDFLEWVQKMELVAMLQKIKDLKSFLPLFLAGGAFAVYQGLPDKDKDDYDKVKRALTSAFSLGPFVAYEEFMTRRLVSGESVDVYLADLKRLATLVAKKVDEEWLKCAFVCGLPGDIKAQVQTACSLTTMKLHEVVEKARSLVVTKVACFASISRGGGGGTSFTHNVGRSRGYSGGGRGGRGSIQCYQCNGYGHMARECPSSSSANRDQHVRGGNNYRGGGGDRVCHICGKSGHLSRACPSGTDVSKNE